MPRKTLKRISFPKNTKAYLLQKNTYSIREVASLMTRVAKDFGRNRGLKKISFVTLGPIIRPHKIK